MLMRTFVHAVGGREHPSSMAKGPIPASRLPQFWPASMRASSTTACRKR
jgi:hypothetical protein